MAVSETIQELLQGIDDAQYGRDMRDYIHKGIQKCYEEGSAGETDLEARTRLDTVEATITEILANVAITETGTSNGWHYHKYSDGTYEAWKNALVTDDITTSKNGVYISDSGYYFTAPTFSTSITYGLACIDRTDTDGIFISRVHPFTNALIIMLGSHTSISSASCYVTARIEGEWS